MSFVDSQLRGGEGEKFMMTEEGFELNSKDDKTLESQSKRKIQSRKVDLVLGLLIVNEQNLSRK